MIQRMLLAATLVATLALTAGSAPAQELLELDAKKNVSVVSVTLTPNTLQANGGPVSATFRLKRKKGVSIRTVTVYAKVNGKNGASVAATAQGNDTYTANVSVAGNSSKKTLTATVYTRVNTNKGTNNLKLGTVKITPASNDPTEPPPPPPI